MPPSPQSFKAAVLVLSPGTSALDTAFQTAFREKIVRASPGAEVHFFDPIAAQTYPELEPGTYDLLVLTGGGGEFDADAEGVAWIEKLKDFVRDVARGGKQKMVSVCWGHQVTHVAFGGAVGEGAVEIGVHDLALTRRGAEFFAARTASLATDASSLAIHQFHERCVTTPGGGFVALAGENQCYVNEANTVLTLQGHPEMDAELSKELLGVSSRYNGGTAEAIMERIERAHDGALVWARMVAWARE